jgi:hypothetical protein
MVALVEAAAKKLNTSGDDILIWFGRSAMPLLAKRYPEVFEGHDNARSFILTLNDVIHPAVRKLFPGAYVPEFDYDASKPDGVTLSYASKRQLCRFAEGLAQGAADHFGEEATVVHERCTKQGDPACVISIGFKALASA